MFNSVLNAGHCNGWKHANGRAKRCGQILDNQNSPSYSSIPDNEPRGRHTDESTTNLLCVDGA